MHYLKLILAFILGMIPAFFFPFFIDIFVVFLVIIMAKKRIKNNESLLIAFIIGFCFELIFITVSLLNIYLTPINLPYYNNHVFARSLIFGGKISNYEILLSSYCSSIITKNDPFTGKKYLEINGVSYSVGPDGIDNGLKLIYDPTNGTISPGDIIVPK